MNYYELEPKDNHFHDVVIDVTHQCNMSCKNCYIPNRDIPDMDIKKMLTAIGEFPKRTNIRVIGAEPTMRKDLHLIIAAIKESGHRQILLTNGLKLANPYYVDRLKQHGLSHVYLSLNGVDNDEWYEAIDEKKCAERKVQALKNLHERRFIIQTGTILVKGINETAPERLLWLLKQLGIKNCVIRLKNVGQLGRHIKESDGSLSLRDMMHLIHEQTSLSLDYLEYWRNKPIVESFDPEPSTFMFPLNPESEYKPINRGGVWIKIVDWDMNNDSGVPSPNSVRRGRLTQDFKVAPFFEHVKLNEGGY